MYRGSIARFGGYLRTRWASPRRIRFWFLMLLVSYTLFGFFGLPWIIQYHAAKTVQEDYDHKLNIDAVHTNPFTLTLRINGVSLNDPDNRLLLSWQQLFLDISWSSLVNKTWDIQTVRLDNPVVREEHFESGETRLSRLLAERPDKASAENEPVTMPEFNVANLQLKNGVLQFTDKPGGVSLELQDIALSANNFSSQKKASFPLLLESQLATGGSLSLNGSVQLLPEPSLEGNVNLNKLVLAPLEPYLRQFIKVRLNSGTLSLNGKIGMSARQPFTYKGSARIDTLSISEEDNSETLLSWKNLQTETLNLLLRKRQLHTDLIVVEGLAGRVVIKQDQTTNVADLLTQLPANADDSNADANQDNTPPDISIEGVELIDGSLRFADHSLPLPFSTRIHKLKGQISSLNSTSEQPAQVEMEGQIAEYGMANVKATIHAWQPMQKTELQLTFRNLQVPEYSPYTVDFAGRKIAGGTMDLDLNYTVSDQKLDGKNSLLLHNLKLGEKMAADSAMDLPLDLAIAVLENNDGIIDLTIPVSGNVGDPEFNFSKVIRQALGSVITSVITAPFRFLANLVGAEQEDLGQVEFAQGRTDLLPPQRERINKLGEALKQRPALVLELAGPFSKSFDGKALQRSKAIEAMRQRLTESQSDGEAAKPNLTAESNQQILEGIFSHHYRDADLEEIRARFNSERSSDSDNASFDGLAYRNHLAEKVIAAQSVTREELKALANKRATAVRDALINPDAGNGIAADRLRLLDPREIDSVNGDRIAMKVGISNE